MTYAPIQIHSLHPRPLPKAERLPLAEFRSGQQPDNPAASVVDYCAGVLRPTAAPPDILAADAFRFHSSLYYDGTHVPVLVAIMRDPVTTMPVGIQRTFLTPSGEKIERRMFGSAGVVMLSPIDDVTYGLGLAEGMENGVAIVTIAGWRPVWAAMSAGAIRHFPVLSGIESLTIFADPEQIGMDTARACARRWADAGKDVTIAAPPEIERDWNDELRGVA